MTISEMAKLPIHSQQWFNAAFENVDCSETVRKASERICRSYGIYGQADPGYIANVIQAELTAKTSYVTYTQEVTEILRRTGNYLMIDFHLRVDLTGFITVKTGEHEFYHRQFTYDEMKLPARKLADLIVNHINHTK